MIWQALGACEPEGVLGSLGAGGGTASRASHVPCPPGDSTWDAESSWARRLEKSVRESLSDSSLPSWEAQLFPTSLPGCSLSLLFAKMSRHCQVSSPVGDGCDNIPGWLYLFLRSSSMGHSWRDNVPGTHNRHDTWDNVLKGIQIPCQYTPPQVLFVTFFCNDYSFYFIFL